jgi:squalene cyclase
MDAQNAISYVHVNGSNLEIARLRHILYGEVPEASVVRPFLELQSNRGGFPLHMQEDNPETVDSTLTALWWLDGMGMLRAPAGQKALEFLRLTQLEDGGWDEDASIERFDPPPWIHPGDLNTKLYLSAYACYWLASAGYLSDRVLGRGMDFLLPHQKESGMFSGYVHTTWIAASVCLMAGLTEPTSKSLQALLDWPISDWEDSQIAWALDCLHRGGIERNHALIEKLLARLEMSQKPDGQWASEDGEASAVSATIEVLKVVKLYSGVPELPRENKIFR